MSKPILCICQICNCGRHRCPHKPKGIITKSCELSEYKKEFVAHTPVRVEPFRPIPQKMDSNAAMNSDTTHRLDYIEHPISVQKSCKQNLNYEPSGIPFEGLSTYNIEYTGKSSEPAKLMKPLNRKSSLAKFDGEASYKIDYRPWKLESRTKAFVRDNNWNPPKSSFNGIPTYTTDYVAYSTSPPASFKPNVKYNNPDIPFATTTDYRDTYQAHDLSARAHPIKHNEAISRSTVPMENVSTHKSDFGWKNAEPTLSCKPENKNIASNEPLQDETTHRIDYKPWPASERQQPIQHLSNGFQKSVEEMCSHTTYNNDYVPFSVEQRQPIRKPDNRKTENQLPFEGTSDYKDSYRRWPFKPMEKSMPKEASYAIPKVPFEGCSINKLHYIPHSNYEPVKSFKPIKAPLHSDEPFDDSTLYRSAFTYKRLEPCPAAFLNSQLSNFTFAKTNDAGHMFYYPTNQANCKPLTEMAETTIAVN